MNPSEADTDAATRASSGLPKLPPTESGQLPENFLRLSAGSDSSAANPTAALTTTASSIANTTSASSSAPLASSASNVQDTDQILADEKLARELQAVEAGSMPMSSSTQANSQPEAPVYIQQLRLTIFQAKLQKNYGLLKMDTYCKVRVGNIIFSTEIASSGGKNPTWNRTIHCNLSSGIDSFYLEIYDQGTFSDDELVAWAYVPIPETALSGNRVIDWYPLSGKLGDGKEGVIQIATQVEYVSAAVPAAYYVTAPMVTGGVVQPLNVVPPTNVDLQHYAAVPATTFDSRSHSQPRSSDYDSSSTSENDRTPSPVTVNEDDVAQLKEMFSSVEISAIRCVLEASRGHKEQAINALLQLAADTAPNGH